MFVEQMRKSLQNKNIFIRLKNEQNRTTLQNNILIYGKHFIKK